jgi:N-acyl-D-aspartate/D-glutamate deacylase
VREIAAWDLVNVEAIPFDVLSQGVTWDWETFPEYMDAAAKRGAGINLGFMAPLTPFRHYVMGEESMDRAATPEETSKITALLKEAMQAGAFGFSTTNGPQHIGYQGRPLACRLASREELSAYGGVLKDLGRGTIELALNDNPGVVSESDYALLDHLATSSNRPVTWLALLSRDDKPDVCMETLERTLPLIKRGVVPQVSSRPLSVQINLRNPFIFANLPSWNAAFNRTAEEQITLYREDSFRQAFRKTMDEPRVFAGQWDRVIVHEAVNPTLKQHEGKSVADVAKERGKDGLDTFLDLAIEDELNMQYVMYLFNASEERVAELINHPNTLIGLSDGGAHVDMLCDAGYCTYLLGHWVREKQVISLERAVQRITQEPAAFFGVPNRGVVAEGKAADFAIFDAGTIGSPKRPEMRHDLPGGGRRLVMPAHGVIHTVVNGEVLYQDAQHTGALPGQVLRSNG